MAGYWWIAGLAPVAVAGWTTAILVALRRSHAEQRSEARINHNTQAEGISAWPGPKADPQPVTLLNGSDEPVYEAVATFVFVDGSRPARGEDVPPALPGRRVRIGVIPPGRWRVRFEGGWDGEYSRVGVEVAFTDRAGAHWVRRAGGRLEPLPRGAFDHFELPRPLDLIPPEPDDLDEGAERGVEHHGRIRSFRFNVGLGRRWSARCSCGWIVTTASQPEACGEFARHYRGSRVLSWRASDRPGRAAA